ncbi:MAG: hypothetical protein ACLR8J_10850 [Sutterella wadsworthensis]
MTQTKRTTAARKKPARKSPRAGSVLAWLFGIAAAGIASGVLLAVFVFAFIYRQLPPIDTLADYRPRVPLRVWSADGKLIGEFGRSAATSCASPKCPTTSSTPFSPPRTTASTNTPASRSPASSAPHSPTC